MRKADIVEQLRGEGFLVTEWSDEAGARYEKHAHSHREVRIVLRGDITFLSEGASRTVRAGERIDFAPGQEHAAHVGVDGATYLSGTK